MPSKVAEAPKGMSAIILSAITDEQLAPPADISESTLNAPSTTTASSSSGGSVSVDQIPSVIDVSSLNRQKEGLDVKTDQIGISGVKKEEALVSNVEAHKNILNPSNNENKSKEEAKAQKTGSEQPKNTGHTEYSKNQPLGKGESATFCRICHEVGSTDLFISPCDCKGSLSVVHKRCLERWLAESNTNICELCGYEYNVMRLANLNMIRAVKVGFDVIFVLAVSVSSVISLDNVVELTDQTFNDVVPKYDVAVIMFMAPWCGNCKKLNPKMKFAASELAKTPYNVKLFRINCPDEGEQICKRYSVTGYPTIKVFKKGEFWKEYDGPQVGEGIMQYVIEHVRPCPAVIDTEEKLHYLTSDGNVYVGFFQKGHQAELKDVFLQSAKDQHGYARMGVSENPEMIEKYCPNQGIVFFRDQRLRNKFESDSIVYGGNESQIALESWMAKVKHGLVGIRTPENIRDFKPPLVVAYYIVDLLRNVKQTNYWRNRVLKVARKFRNYTFAVSDKYQFDNDFFQFGYKFFPGMEKLPIVLARTKKEKYKMAANFSTEALQKFVQGINKKLLEPFVRSQTPPKKNDGVVKTVVADTFEQMVIESGRDSFIMLYTTDCPHCKRIRPLWTRLGEAMDGEEVDILKMDVGKNDRPSKYKLVGMPVLYWVPKTDKKNPVRYTGHHEYFELIEFIAKRATNELIARDRKGKIRKQEL